ncbi:MAG: phosphotransferase [Chloroflexota bacterium]
MGSVYGAPDLPALVDFVNAQHGTTYRVTDRYLGGERGAAGLTDARGDRFVFKWVPSATDLGRLPAIVKTVDRLRGKWYPAPRYVARGLHPDGCYSVQSMLPGAPIRRFTPVMVEQILALNDLQRGLAPPPEPPPARPSASTAPSPATSPAEPLPSSPSAVSLPEPWPASVASDVLHGGPGYCLLDPMRQHSPQTARLLEIVQELAAEHQHASTPTTDVVHCDFQHSNILGLSGKISGIVDWDGTRSGDRAFDLVTLLFYAHDDEAVRETLWQRILTLTAPAASVVYLAHLIHRQVDWSLRRHPSATTDQWLERARAILGDLPARTGCPVPAWP